MADAGPMVHLTTVHSGFHGRVIAARLGADGILTQLRGGVGGPYPIGDVEVLVHQNDLEDARALLLADAAEAEAHGGDDDGGARVPGWRAPVPLWVFAVLVLMAVVALLGRF